MADLTPLTDILNDNEANATPVQNNFQAIENYVNGGELLRADGTKVATGNIDFDGNKAVSVADGVSDSDAATMSQLAARTPYLVYHGSGTQVFTALQSANVTIDTETYDIGTVGSVGSATLTMPSTGLYLGLLEASAAPVSGTASVNLYLTGSAPVGTFISTLFGSTASQAFNSKYITSSSTFTLGAANNTLDGGIAKGATLTFDVKIYRLV